MAQFYIETNELKTFLKELDGTINSLQDAINKCNNSDYAGNYASELLAYKSRLLSLRGWLDSSCKLYNDYTSTEKANISKSEVSDLKLRDSIIKANY